jgi:hypothetical protein
MRICTNVIKNKLGMYYARLYVPGDLKKLVGKTEIRRTLKTTCYVTAVDRSRPIVAAVRDWFGAVFKFLRKSDSSRPPL